MMIHTPFSTQLSGSAREIELRLQSIFQWKKKRPPLLALVLLPVVILGFCGLVACQKEPIQPEEQLRELVKFRELWKAQDESDWWGYTVTDLDHNGRLEIISSETHGTGHYTTTRLWEVNEDGKGLTACGTDENCKPVMGPTPTAPAYYDAESGRCWYLFSDDVRDSAARCYQSLRALSLVNETVEGRFCALKSTVYDPNGLELVSYQDADRTAISSEEYQQLLWNSFPGLEPLTARFVWVEQHLDELEDDALFQELKHSMEGFALMNAVAPYQEILERYYEAGALMQQNLQQAWNSSYSPDDLLVNGILRPYWAAEHNEDFLSRIGYAIQDLNGDGVDELLLGWIGNQLWNMDAGYVFAIYTLEGSQPTLAVEGWERCRFVLCADGTLCKESAGGAAEGSCIRYRFPNIPLEAIWYGWNHDTNSICYVYSSDPAEIQAAAHPSTYTQWMDPVEARQRMEDWMNDGKSISCTPLAAYKPQPQEPFDP